MIDGPAAGSPAEPATVTVWDPFVRVFHWTLAAACGAELLLLDGGRAPHRWVGYAAAGLVAARVVWGFVGSRHARFRDFVPHPLGLLVYLGALLRGREPRTLGHNPAAAAMILVLMGVVAALGVTGWMTTLDAFWGAAWLEDLHGWLADALAVLVVVHAAAAAVESVRHRENLVLAMITGRKRAQP